MPGHGPTEVDLRILPLTLAAMAMCGLSTVRTPRLVWNATASAPIGLYLLSAPNQLARGDLALAEPPAWVHEFAAERGYLPLQVSLIKRIAALGGDTVCNINERVFIDGRWVAMRLASDGRHRPLPAWHGCHFLRRSEIFLLTAEVPGSFDGRYFGTIAASAIKGKLRPLWLP